MIIPVSNRAGVRLEGGKRGVSRGNQYIGGQRPEFHVNRKRREKGRGKNHGKEHLRFSCFFIMIATWARMTLYDFYPVDFAFLSGFLFLHSLCIGIIKPGPGGWLIGFFFFLFFGLLSVGFGGFLHSYPL